MERKTLLIVAIALVVILIVYVPAQCTAASTTPLPTTWYPADTGKNVTMKPTMGPTKSPAVKMAVDNSRC